LGAVLSLEGHRHLQVQVLLAQHDRDTLRSKLEDVSVELDRAEMLRATAEAQLAHEQDSLTRLQASLRARQRDIENLNVSFALRCYWDSVN
jgi:predicted  nucleic acid-binding Zn-ribbon protein